MTTSPTFCHKWVSPLAMAAALLCSSLVKNLHFCTTTSRGNNNSCDGNLATSLFPPQRCLPSTVMANHCEPKCPNGDTKPNYFFQSVNTAIKSEYWYFSLEKKTLIQLPELFITFCLQNITECSMIQTLFYWKITINSSKWKQILKQYKPGNLYKILK